MFDSYAKTVMRNVCRNIIRSVRKRQQYETLGTEKMKCLFENQQHTDIYPSEHIMVYDDVFICVITKVDRKKKKIVIIAHRISTIIDADNIIVINNRRIVEEGTHKELLKNNEIYLNLYTCESKLNNNV